MKLGLQTFNVKRATTITARAEGKKKNLPQKKSVKVEDTKPQEVKKELPKRKEVVEDKPRIPVFKEMVEPKRIDVTDNTYIKVSASQMDGDSDTYVDVRIYKKTDKFEGPTKKGIRIHVEFLEELIDALSVLNDELDAQGL